MALPSQAARPMSASATKFSTSRSYRRSPLKKSAGWGIFLLVVIGFGWWAMNWRAAGESGKVVTAEDQAKLAAASALESAPGDAPEPSAVPAISNSVPAETVTMGTSGTKPVNPPIESVSASNTPGTIGSSTSQAATPGTTPPPLAPGSNPGSTVPKMPAADPAATPAAGQPGGGPGGNPPGGSMGSSLSGSMVSALASQGDSLLSQGKPVEARDAFNRALFDGRATESDRRVLRDKLAAIAEAITFSPRAEPGDAMVEMYSFQKGDRLVKLPYTRNLAVDWRLITRINRIADPGKMGLNQRIKLIKGPFHAVVSKSAFRMDVFSNTTDSQGNRIFIKSMSVGLGEHGSTPIGSFVVKPKSKLVNPKWVNPRTGEKFAADDPKNPIGERWIGLVGTDKTTELLSGYGIHGTIEPESIGTEKSMGCVRLADKDVELVYELLFEGASTVEIRP